MIHVDRLSKRFGSIHAVRGVSFTIGRGEIVHSHHLLLACRQPDIILALIHTFNQGRGQIKNWSGGKSRKQKAEMKTPEF